LLSKLTSGISNEDPFYDKSIVEDLECIEDLARRTEYDKIIGQNNSGNSIVNVTSKIKGIQSNNTKSEALTNYVSLGNFILAVIGSHVAYSGSFDEIQIVSYTLNNNAGLAANSNISSLLIDKDKLTDYIYQLFQNGAQYTLENLLMQVIKKFATTRFCVNYGLSDFYELDKNNNVVPKEGKSDKSKIKFEVDINERIRKIHEYRKKQLRLENDKFFPEIKFVLPKIKLLFDSVTRSSGTESILRISIIDQHDNPFESTTQIMNKVYEKGVPSAIYDINKRLITLKSLAKDKKDIKKEKAKFIEENKKIIDMLEKKGILIKNDNGDYILDSLTPQDNFASSIKNSLKTIMPSVTYGTNNSAVLEASISTINEAKLNTVYITRPDRNLAPIKSKVSYKQDLPLRILPSQVNMTIFGCPFISFAQYLFLDFETNTTIDNQYIVTGLKHDITPGKFTTSLTLSYGDAYGKYETIVDTLNRTLKEIETGEVEVPNSKQVYSGVDIVKNTSIILDETESLDLTTSDPMNKYNSEALQKLGWADNSIPINSQNNNLSTFNIRISGLDNYKIRKYNVGSSDVAFYKVTPEIEFTNKLHLKFSNFHYYINNNDKSKNKVMYIDIFKKFKTVIPNSDFAKTTFNRTIEEKEFSYFSFPGNMMFSPKKENDDYTFSNTNKIANLFQNYSNTSASLFSKEESFLTDLIVKNKSHFYDLENLLNKKYIKLTVKNHDSNDNTTMKAEIIDFIELLNDDIDNAYSDKINAIIQKINYEYKKHTKIKPIFHPQYSKDVKDKNNYILESAIFNNRAEKKDFKISFNIRSDKKTKVVKINGKKTNVYHRFTININIEKFRVN